MRKIYALFILLFSINIGHTQSITWNFGTAAPGNEFPSSAAIPNLSVSGLSYGNNNGTTNPLLSTTSASSGYTGSTGSYNAGVAARTGVLNTAANGSAYFEFTLTPAAGFTVKVNAINFGARSTSTAPQAYSIRTSLDGFVGDSAAGTLINASAWAYKTNVNSITGNGSTPLTIRIYGHSGTGSPSANTTNWRIDDLDVAITLSGSSGGGLTIFSLSPANLSTNVSPLATLTVAFNSNVTAGTGNIYIKKLSDNSIVRAFAANLLSDVTVINNQASFTPGNLAFSTTYYVEMDAGTFTDGSNSFAGISGSSTWSFTTTAPPPTGVIGTNYSFNTCTGTAFPDGFSHFSVTGAQTWACTTFGRDPSNPTLSLANGVQMNGFSGTNIINEDWFISPAYNLTATNYPLLSFWSRTRFNGAPLELKVSTNYPGIGDPNLFTWTTLNGKFPAQTTDIWTESNNINLSAFKTANVYVAFVYHSSADDGARWTLDDIMISNSLVPPPPSLSVSTADIQFGFAAAGNNITRSFTVLGNDITGDITLNATAGFSLADNAGGPFSASLVLTQATSNNINRTVFARFSPTLNNQNYSGTYTISTPLVTNATVTLHGTSIDPLNTLEVVNWNIEWFGSPDFGPTNDALQQANVQTIMQNIGADIYGLTEIVNETALATVVAAMPGYAYVISNFGSHTNTSVNPPTSLASAQKLAYVYKTSVFSNITTQALVSQGINSAADITNPAYNYFSSGRFPYMMSADVTLNGITQQVRFVLIHGKANTSPTLTSYNRRKSGSDTLNFTLNTLFPNDKIVVLGDFNDDLDSTITDGINPKITSYSAFTNDVNNFFAPSLALSLAGKKSTVSYNDVIDHVVVSNEMQCNYMGATANIITDVTTMVANYGTTTSDHYPVFSRYSFDLGPNANISYAASPYCQSGGTATVTHSGTTGGTYSSTAGLSINATTGTVTLATSTPGSYTVIYSIPASGGCPAYTTTAAITINAAPAATISYAGSPYCMNGGTATVTATGSTGGIYSSTTGLTINGTTGAITLGSSTQGTYTVTYTIAAANGCAMFTTSTTVTVNGAPVITCPANIVVSNTTGQCGAIVNYPPATATGTPAATITYSMASGSFFPVGTTTVTATATNSCGTVNCTFTVRVNDTQLPVISCPANITVTTATNACTMVVNYTVTATDNCPGVVTARTAGLASGASFPIGTTVVTWTATDASNNVVNCSFNVTVIDGQSPIIATQPANRTVCVNGSASFGITTNGTGITFQWQESVNNGPFVNLTNTSPYSGVTSNSLTVSPAGTILSGRRYRVIATNGTCGNQVSNIVTLTVNQVPSAVLSVSTYSSYTPSQRAQLNVTVSPAGAYTYQWFKNGFQVTSLNSAGIIATVDDFGEYYTLVTDATTGCSSYTNRVTLRDSLSSQLFLYPNPSKGKFVVRFYSPNNTTLLRTLNVYDSRGTRIYSKAYSVTRTYDRMDVDLGNVPAGIYMIELKDHKGIRIVTEMVVVSK